MTSGTFQNKKRKCVKILPRSHLYVKSSRESSEAIFAKWNGTWLSCGSYGVCVALRGSTWLLRGLYIVRTTRKGTRTPRTSQVNPATATSDSVIATALANTLLKSDVTRPDHVVRCRGSQECGSRSVNFACKFHSGWHSLRITLKSTTLLFMRCSNVWTTKPWQRS